MATIISGVAVIVTLMRHPDGIANAGSLGDRFRAWRARRRSPVEAEAPAERPELAVVPSVRRPPIQVDDEVPALFVEDLSVHYGGIVAVAGLSLRIPAGRVIGLIGPNGAGKTSAIDAVSGFAEARGAVTLDGDRIDDLPTHRRVRRGLGRTFQSLELYDDLSVEENVRAAAFGAKADDSHEAVAWALDIVGIADLRDREAGDLSQGQRQLVSIARSCATDPRVLLLDEPAAGLDTTESRWLGDRILQISATGVGVMLVDHDVALVLGICDYVYVLDFGLLIAEGTPTEIRANRAVTSAYLGNAHANVAVTASIVWCAAGCPAATAPRPCPRPRLRRPGRIRYGPARAQRRRQDDAAPHPDRAAARARRDRGDRRDPAQRRTPGAGQPGRSRARP